MSVREYGRLRWKLKMIAWKRGARKWLRTLRNPARDRREEQMEFGW